MKKKRTVLAVLCALLLLTVAGILVARVMPKLLAQNDPSLNAPNQTTVSTDGISSVATDAEVLTSQPADALHEHSFDRLLYTKKATCEEIGYKRYVCQCGITQMQDVEDPIGHDWDDGIKKEATCTEEGGKLYTCERCGETELRDPVEAKDHSFGVWEEDPEEPAREIRICRVCNTAQYRGENIPTQMPTEAPTEAPTVPVELLDSHCVIITDIENGRIVVTDLDNADPFAKENLIWEWTPTPAKGWSYITQSTLKDAISGVKYRWSEYYQKNVVLFTSSRGTAGMIEYPSGKCLWKARVGYSPHSIELLPNGDIVVASSGGGTWDDGRLTYFELTASGSYTATTEHMLYSAHGVTWDPENNILWASGFQNVEAYELTTNSQGQATLSKVAGKGAVISDGSGHDLMQDYSDTDILWITTNQSILQFSKSKNAILTGFPNSETLKRMTGVKGVAGFSDGVVAFVSYADGVDGAHPNVLRTTWPRSNGSFETVKYTDTSSGWNKVRVFTDQYQ